MIIATLLVSAQIPELTKSTVLMRERSRVEKTICAMQHTGASGLQVTSLFPFCLSDYTPLICVQNNTFLLYISLGNLRF